MTPFAAQLAMTHGLFWNAVPKSKAKYAPLDQGRSCDEDEGADRFPPTRRSGWPQTTKRLVQVFVVSQLIALPAGAVIWYLNRQQPMNMYWATRSSSTGFTA
ncbi:hypothetical protein CSHISOI_10746 [Colletotrichum shisoi]|uniref:Uncharacterized protein n=1 Tax=Colletotrichum shisoi TaxID=2078593 RepID=A0A5Q4BDH9_9PEZI|nr:hypothetical protein CSHISOI_10746 [Colletotrichum shisoi]